MHHCLEETTKLTQSHDLSWIKQLAELHRRELGFVNRATLAAAIDNQEIICLPLCIAPINFLNQEQSRDNAMINKEKLLFNLAS